MASSVAAVSLRNEATAQLQEGLQQFLEGREPLVVQAPGVTLGGQVDGVRLKGHKNVGLRRQGPDGHDEGEDRHLGVLVGVGRDYHQLVLGH